MLYRKISHAEYRRLLKSALRIQCKPELSKPDITHIFIKMSNFSSPTFPLLKELFPDVQQMFITRKYRESLLSYFKIVRGLPQIWYWMGESYNFFINHMTFPVDDPHWWQLYREEKSRGFTDEEGIAFGFSGSIETFLRHKDNYDHVMLYEDIRAEPEREARALFDALGLDDRYIPDALAAMREDSQQGVLGVRGNAHITLTEEEIANTEAMFRLTDSPLSLDMTLDQLRELIYPKSQIESRRDSNDSGIANKVN
jgi:hypothetical protein